MRKPAIILLLLFRTACSLAQLTDRFDDGDYTDNPAWLPGNTDDWLVNANGQLQSNHRLVNSSFYISTTSTKATSTQWEFWIRLAFNTSSANYVDVFLTASAADLSLNSTSGYFVRIGNTQDEVSLYRKDPNGTITKLIDGVDGVTDRSDNVLKIKVNRDDSNRFTLHRDITGSGSNYTLEGSVVDATYITSGFFGFLVRQSTASFFQRHYFDDVEVKDYVPDTSPPQIVSAIASSPTAVDVLFSEAVEQTSAETVANYLVNEGIGVPVSALRNSTNPALVTLQFVLPFDANKEYTLTVTGVKDLSQNVLQNGLAVFSFYRLRPYDIVINEILADPSPPVGLPNAEFIELKNRSGRSVNLQGWRLASASSVSGAFPAYTLPADSFLIVTTNAAASQFDTYGRVIGVGGFPSLPNEAGLVQLLAPDWQTIHAVAYSTAWHDNTVKADGGWTLEMVDSNNPCTGDGNWKSSTDRSGGTPGRRNAVAGSNPDSAPPQLVRTYSTDSLTLILVFNEVVDSISAANPSRYTFTNGLQALTAAAQPPLFNRVELHLAAPMQKQTVYTVSVTGIQDCSGNEIGVFNKAKAGWGDDAVPADVVVNEILFNPHPNGFDYVELYNRSSNIIDAAGLHIANRNSSGAVASHRRLTEEPYAIFPGDYLVLTPDKASLQQLYLVKSPEVVLPLSLPSYPDDKGTVVLLNARGELVDEVSYDKDWHFALVSNPEGIALERIKADGPSQNRNNWHSAASTAGYGTPGYQNSQFRTADDLRAVIAVSPQVFSPDGDGRDDIATIQYRTEEKGYLANVFIFDAGGRLVRHLVKNDLMAETGFWKWDGLGEKWDKLPVGTYIVFTELFNLEGKKKSFKNTVVLARQLK